MSDTPLLAQPSPDSISALFDADPTTLSDAALDTLIAELRRRRCEFAAQEAATQAAGKKARPPKGTVSAATQAELDKPLAELSLSDLTPKPE